MNRILRCDWLPEQARWSYLARSGLSAVLGKKNFPESHIINPLLPKLVWPRYLDIGPVLFFASLWSSTGSVSVNRYHVHSSGSSLEIDRELTFQSHVDRLCKKQSLRIGILKIGHCLELKHRVLLLVWFISINMLFRATLVEEVFTYQLTNLHKKKKKK